jgi:HD-GYP domain-containing protein (c-di-GMP phosphodiesterase class II)
MSTESILKETIEAMAEVIKAASQDKIDPDYVKALVQQVNKNKDMVSSLIDEIPENTLLEYNQAKNEIAREFNISFKAH